MMNPAARNLLCGVSEHEAFAPGERLQGQGRERGYSRERNRTGKERGAGEKGGKVQRMPTLESPDSFFFSKLLS